MTAQEKLSEIKRWAKIYGSPNNEDTQWLIARVEELTVALEKIKRVSYDDRGEFTIARKALEECPHGRGCE